MEPRNKEVLGLLQHLDDATLMEATRAIGISGGGFTKAISDLRRTHGFSIRKVTKTDPITETRYPVYSLNRLATPTIHA